MQLVYICVTGQNRSVHRGAYSLPAVYPVASSCILEVAAVTLVPLFVMVIFHFSAGVYTIIYISTIFDLMIHFDRGYKTFLQSAYFINVYK